jgi:hypothetical protein
MSDISPQSNSIQCPSCGSTQFFGREKVTAMRGVLYISAAIVGLFSIFLGALSPLIGPIGLIGFLTLFLVPVLSLIGFYGCREIVNTCSNCKRDF